MFQPLRLWLEQQVNRVMYGERDDPYAVVSQLGQRLEGTLAPETVLPTIVQSVAEALEATLRGDRAAARRRPTCWRRRPARST